MPSRPVTGIALMTLAMLLIPVVDGIGKLLSAHHSPLFVTWARYAVASAIVIPYAVVRHGRRFLPDRDFGAHFLRTVFLMISMTLYFVAVSRIPMAAAISAYFIGPIFAALLAVLVLGERLSARKIVALALGFGGAMLIVRPGAALDPGILLAITAGLFFGAYLIATRKASLSSDPLRTLAFQCLVGAILLLPQALYAWSVPRSELLFLFGLMGLFSAISHILSITAFRFAEASLLSPLVYLELIGSALFGYFVFREVPGATTWVGATIIVAGGLLLLHQQRKPSV